MDVTQLQPFQGRRIRLRLHDHTEYTGTLRTELLSDRAISVYLVRDDGEGATIYLDDIVGIWENH